jgi:hypothetical protein
MTTTVLIDEAATVANRRELFHLLRAGTTEGLVAVRKGKSFTSYGARVVSWLELPDDPALNSRCLLIPMKHCERTDLLSPKDPQILRFAKKLQRQLLQFRFMNYKALPLPKIPGEEELQARTRDLLRALALPWGQDEEMCEGLCGVLRRQESLRQVLSVQQSAVLDSLYGVIHSYPELSGLSVSELTETINVNLRRIGELGKMSEKRVGNLLTSLHLTDRTRLNSGFVLWLTRETRQQIHTLAYTYGVNKGPTPKMSAGCDLCQKLSVAPTSRSEAKPVEGRERVESKSSRELGEHREHGKRRARGKSARGVPGASSSR